MKENERLEHLIECLIHVIGRAAVPINEVREIVGTGAKQIRAFNLCDGRRTQGDVVKAAKIDQGNLSRTSDRWVKNGVAFWIGDGADKRLLHIYPIPESQTIPGKGPKNRK